MLKKTADKFHDIQGHGAPPVAFIFTVFEKVLSMTIEKSTILAIGNMGGMGAETAEYFEHRSSINND